MMLASGHRKQVTPYFIQRRNDVKPPWRGFSESAILFFGLSVSADGFFERFAVILLCGSPQNGAHGLLTRDAMSARAPYSRAVQ